MSLDDLISANPQLLIPNDYTGISPIQCVCILGELDYLQTGAAETAIATPMTVVGIYQVICGGLPILMANRSQWRKPLWLGSLFCCMFCFTTQVASLELSNAFQINWQKGTPIDLRSPVGLEVAVNGLYGSQVFTAFLSLAEIAYEIIAALRVGIFLGPRSPKAMAIYVFTGFVCMYHLIFCIFIMYYSQLGRDVFAAHASKISKAGVTDLVLTAIIDTTTAALFIWQLASKMGLNRKIFMKFFQSRGVLRLVTNIGLAIATMTQVARPDYQDQPMFAGVFEMWIGWQINTFIQFSFVETKELVQSYSRSIQGSNASSQGPTIMSTAGSTSSKLPPRRTQ
ncbi:hypothetical protein BDZ88DRAFT_220893 [Geranomyces variabilis]|nr:hypothetical protein BDZ88DRAFT_220893 [Geranomyces variabilis]KAJ3139468.1 hypothetical protein HDU90_008969 [Geranomyces variabilis]